MSISKLISSLFGSQKHEVNRHLLPWVVEQTETVYGLRRLNWDAIYSRADAEFSGEDQNELWSNIAYSWLRALQADLDSNYTISESSNFMLLSCEAPPYNKALLNYMEISRRRLLRYLDGIAKDDGFGKFVVMVFEDNNRYYDYVSYFGSQEGTFGMSGGMFIQQGYGHLVFPHNEIESTELVAGHEMSHALVSHLNLPLWLDEGIAVNMEGVLKSYNSSPMTHDSFAKHQTFWTEENIQEFWFGESFSRADEGQELSYQLARILVSNLSEDIDTFVQFCNQADWQDAGETALQRSYNLSLQDLLVNFLGEGDWLPKARNL